MKKILVVGDIMLDHYIYGTVDRISPEAPVPVVKYEREEFKLGGAGNVIANLRGLGGAVDYYGVVGADYQGDKVRQLIEEVYMVGGILMQTTFSHTTSKQRVIADNQYQLLRVDNDCLPDKVETQENFNPNSYDLIIISDYGKGAITESLIDHITDFDTKIIVDPYPPHSKWYGDIFMITPNKKEWRDYTYKALGDGDFISPEYVVLTESKDGISLWSRKDRGPFMKRFHMKAVDGNIVNVTGAGDTVVAVLAYCIVNGYDLIKAVKLANMCAGHVCGIQGTTTITKEMFTRFAKEVNSNEENSEKLDYFNTNLDYNPDNY